MADGTRRSIMERLVHGPLAVGELARDLPVSSQRYPSTSRLKSAGLVCDRASGTRRLYQLDTSGLERLRADLDRFWVHALTAYKSTVDHLEGDQE
jgi:DNA-binding transcriptional ArsR family regulator